MNAVLALAHAAAMRPTLTGAAEWQRLAKAALAEHDRLVAENYRLRKMIDTFGPKHQGMTELA
jgi:hypothetical protein